MTELEEAVKDYERIKEIDAEVAKCKEFQLISKNAHDNIGDKAWANRIKELNNEKHRLDSKGKYIRFSLFTQTVKAYLTPSQYKECWDRVTEILEHPELMQDAL